MYGHQNIKNILQMWDFQFLFKQVLPQMTLQPGVGLGLRYNMPPGLSVPCSISPFVYTHLSQDHGHVIQLSLSWSSSTFCCIQLFTQVFILL